MAGVIAGYREIFTGGLTNPASGAEDAEPVILIPVGLPCLERGRLYKKGRSADAKGCLDQSGLRAAPAYTAQLLTILEPTSSIERPILVAKHCSEQRLNRSLTSTHVYPLMGAG